jgi:glutamate transport system permease protein
MGVIVDHIGQYLGGMGDTVALTLLSFAIAFVIGVVVAGFRVSPVPPLRAVGSVYVNIVRNTPLLLIFVIFFQGLPKVGILFSPFPSAIVVLSLYTGTFVAETVRAGINSVAVGQAEAGRSLGMTFPQVLVVVVLPQALRTVVQPLGSIFIALIKNSALATIIAVPNLGRVASEVAVETAQIVPSYIGAGLAYLALTLPSGQVVGWLERRVAIKR